MEHVKITREVVTKFSDLTYDLSCEEVKNLVDLSTFTHGDFIVEIFGESWEVDEFIEKVAEPLELQFHEMIGCEDGYVLIVERYNTN